jgi:hypothetical protein
MKIINSPILLAAALLLFAACERQDNELDQAEAAPALGEVETTAFYDELDGFTAEAVLFAESEEGRVLGNQSAIPSCAILSYDPDTRLITVDFGVDCSDERGNVRSGKLLITRTGRYFQTGSTITTTLEGYVVNGIAVEGTRTLTNVSTSENLQFSIQLRGGRATWPDGTFAEREADLIRSWVGTGSPLTDAWHITGSASGSNRLGQEFTSTITEALVFTLSCMGEGIFVPAKGVQVITRPAKPLITLNWGNGTCDRVVTISMNGRSRTITLAR